MDNDNSMDHDGSGVVANAELSQLLQAGAKSVTAADETVTGLTPTGDIQREESENGLEPRSSKEDRKASSLLQGLDLDETSSPVAEQLRDALRKAGSRIIDLFKVNAVRAQHLARGPNLQFSRQFSSECNKSTNANTSFSNVNTPFIDLLGVGRRREWHGEQKRVP